MQSNHHSCRLVHWWVLIHWGHQIRHQSIVKGKISRHFSYHRMCPVELVPSKDTWSMCGTRMNCFFLLKGIQSHPSILVHLWWKKLFNCVHLLLELFTPQVLPYIFFYIICYVTKGLAHVADLIRLCCHDLCLSYYFIFLLFMCVFH